MDFIIWFESMYISNSNFTDNSRAFPTWPLNANAHETLQSERQLKHVHEV